MPSIVYLELGKCVDYRKLTTNVSYNFNHQLLSFYHQKKFLKDAEIKEGIFFPVLFKEFPTIQNTK